MKKAILFYYNFGQVTGLYNQLVKEDFLVHLVEQKTDISLEVLQSTDKMKEDFVDWSFEDQQRAVFIIKGFNLGSEEFQKRILNESENVIFIACVKVGTPLHPAVKSRFKFIVSDLKIAMKCVQEWYKKSTL